MTTLGERLKNLRLQKDVGQKEVASLLNVQNSVISKYEKNIVSPPPDKLNILAEYFNVTVDYLLNGTTSTKNSPYSKENLLAQFGEEDQKLLLDYIDFLKNRKKD